MGYYSVKKRNEILIYTTMWMNLESIMLNERSQTHIEKSHIQFYLYEMFRIGQSIEIENRLGLARVWERERNGV